MGVWRGCGISYLFLEYSRHHYGLVATLVYRVLVHQCYTFCTPTAQRRPSCLFSAYASASLQGVLNDKHRIITQTLI